MLNIMALVFNRMPDQAPFFVKPLLRAIQKKAEQGISRQILIDVSFLWTTIETEYGIHGK
jgi:hypothetical protein